MVVLGLTDGTAGSAFAQARLEARYNASLAGIKLGQGTWIVDAGDDHFMAVASGMTTGLARVFGKGEGTGASRGLVKGNEFSPTSYSSSMTTGRKTELPSVNAPSVPPRELAPPLRVLNTNESKRPLKTPAVTAPLSTPTTM